MRILLAGATGAIGHTLTPALVAAGHEVFGTTRSEEHQPVVAAAGATPIRMDGLTRHSVLAAVEEAKPDVIIHELTALKGGIDPRHFDRDFAVTNRLRTEGTDHLLEAARTFGVGRFIAQSYTGWTNPPGHGPADEAEGLDPAPAPQARQTLAAIGYLEEVVTRATDFDGLVLRYGGFYGPGTGIARGEHGDLLESVRSRKLPIVGAGAGETSFVHAVDAASATVAAVGHGAPGLYNIVDDDPAPAAEWIPVLAKAVGARPPRHVPTWVVRLLAGEFGVHLMTTARGSSNAKAKRELGWTLRYPSWRQGFTTGL